MGDCYLFGTAGGRAEFHLEQPGENHKNEVRRLQQFQAMAGSIIYYTEVVSCRAEG